MNRICKKIHDLTFARRYGYIAWCHVVGLHGTIRRDFVAIFSAMYDHGALPHGVMQKGSDRQFFIDPVHFLLKFQKKVNSCHFH
jgi:hypothetical protein